MVGHPRQERLQAISVFESAHASEYYEVGKNDVTEIRWSRTMGVGDYCDTVQVFKNGILSSEHPFCNCLGVYFPLPTKES